MLRRIDCTFTACALEDPVPTKRREGAELLKFLFADLKAPGRVFLNILRHPVGSGGAARGEGRSVRILAIKYVSAPVRVGPANRITCIRNANAVRQHKQTLQIHDGYNTPKGSC